MRVKLERLEYDTRLWSLALLFVHFVKVGRDKEKDSLELWLNTFFFPLETLRILALLCLFLLGTE